MRLSQIIWVTTHSPASTEYAPEEKALASCESEKARLTLPNSIGNSYSFNAIGFTYVYLLNQISELPKDNRISYQNDQSIFLIASDVFRMYTVFGQPLCSPYEVQHGGFYVAIPFGSNFKQIKYHILQRSKRWFYCKFDLFDFCQNTSYSSVITNLVQWLQKTCIYLQLNTVQLWMEYKVNESNWSRWKWKITKKRKLKILRMKIITMSLSAEVL